MAGIVVVVAVLHYVIILNHYMMYIKNKYDVFNHRLGGIYLATTIIFLIIMIIVIFAVKNSLLHFKGKNDCCGGGSMHNIRSRKMKHKMMGSIEIDISGMYCHKCAHKLTQSLHEIEGVSVTVNLEKKNVILSYDRPIDIQEVYDTIQNAGYQIICTHKIL